MPKTARQACGKSIEFVHLVNDDLAMFYFTDGTYLLVKQNHGYQGRLQFEYVDEEMGG
jgi:hypothetical protein